MSLLPWRAKWLALMLVLVSVAGSGQAFADDEEDEDAYRARHEHIIHADLTYDEVYTVDRKPLNAGHTLGDTSSYEEFSPDTESLEVTEAWVTDADGTRHEVRPQDIFTRSAPQAANEPGFNSKQRITVVFPRVGPGAETHLQWTFRHKQPEMFGINLFEGPGRDRVDDLVVTITLPPSLPLKWHADPGIITTDTVKDGSREITAHFKDIPTMNIGYNTVANSEFRPRFMATTLQSLADYGNLIFAASETTPTPQDAARVKALADSIAGDKKGLDAAAAIHDWIQQNVAYAAVYLNPNDGWVEHPVGKIIDNGYGDCKDQVALMRALLAARGIRAERVVVNWGDRFTPAVLPIAWQFNHVIIYLPDFAVFDNPTDQTAPFAAIDEGLSGKQAVLVAKNSRTVRLPPATPATFWERNESTLTLSPDGSIAGEAEVSASPTNAEDYENSIKKQGKDNFLHRFLANNNQEGDGSLSLHDPETWRDPLTLKARWTAQNYVDLSEQDIFLPLESGFDPNRLTALAHRIRNDVHVAPMLFSAFSNRWHFTWTLPQGITVKHLPAPVHIANKAGRFDSEVTSTTTEKGQQITLTRSFISNQTVYSPAEYPDLRELLTAAVKSGHAHAILTRGGQGE